MPLCPGAQDISMPCCPDQHCRVEVGLAKAERPERPTGHVLRKSPHEWTLSSGYQAVGQVDALAAGDTTRHYGEQ